LGGRRGGFVAVGVLVVLVEEGWGLGFDGGGAWVRVGEREEAISQEGLVVKDLNG